MLVQMRNVRRLEACQRLVFYGEVGVERHMPFIMDEAGKQLDGDYDRDNPEGTAWGRRNYKESCYLSGMPNLEPAEYDAKEQSALDLARIS